MPLVLLGCFLSLVANGADSEVATTTTLVTESPAAGLGKNLLSFDVYGASGLLLYRQWNFDYQRALPARLAVGPYYSRENRYDDGVFENFGIRLTFDLVRFEEPKNQYAVYALGGYGWSHARAHSIVAIPGKPEYADHYGQGTHFGIGFRDIYQIGNAPVQLLFGSKFAYGHGYRLQQDLKYEARELREEARITDGLFSSLDLGVAF